MDFNVEQEDWLNGEARYKIDVEEFTGLRLNTSSHDDLEAAIELARRLRASLEAYGTSGGEELQTASLQEGLYALRAICDRLGFEFKLPFRDYVSFRTYWETNGGYGSWAARRAILESLFGPLQESLLEKSTFPDAGGTPVTIKPKPAFVIQRALSDASGSSIDAYFSLLEKGGPLLKTLTAKRVSKATRAQNLFQLAKEEGDGSLDHLVEVIIDDATKGRLGPNFPLEDVLAALADAGLGFSDGKLRPVGRAQPVGGASSPSASTTTGPTLSGPGGSPQPPPAPRPVATGGASTTLASGEKKDKAMPSKDPRTVFLVQGRNQKVNRALTDYLVSLDLRVLSWEQVVNATKTPNPYIGDVIRVGMELATAVVVLFTPDDRVMLESTVDPDAKPKELEQGHQPRPNVLIEAGMSLAIDTSHTVIVQFGEMRAATDLDGRHILRIDGYGPTWRHNLANRLRSAGLSVDTSGAHWLTAGNFPTV